MIVPLNAIPEDSSSGGRWARKLVFCVSLFFGLLLISSAVFYNWILKTINPSRCEIPRMYPNFYTVPVLPPDFNTTEVTNKIEKSDQYGKIKTELVFSGRSTMAHRYRLLRFSNMEKSDKSYKPNFNRNIVLFLPGSIGTFSQVRSIGAEGSEKNPKLSSVHKDSMADFYTVDFNEEIGALRGQSLINQAIFVNDCIHHLLNLYNQARYTHYTHEGSFPSDVVNEHTKISLVGHSYGGFITRMLPLMENFDINILKNKNLQIAVGLSAPFQLPVGLHDHILNSKAADINSFYSQMTKMSNLLQKTGNKEADVVYNYQYLPFSPQVIKTAYTEVHKMVQKMPSLKRAVDALPGINDKADLIASVLNGLNSVVFLSVHGGSRDEQVPEWFSDLDGLHAAQISTSLENIKRFGSLSADHLAIVWCKQFVSELVKILYSSFEADFLQQGNVNNRDKKAKHKVTRQGEAEQRLINSDVSNTISRKNRLDKLCFNTDEYEVDMECVAALNASEITDPNNFDVTRKLLIFQKSLQIGANISFPLSKYGSLHSKELSPFKSLNFVFIFYKNVALSLVPSALQAALLLALFVYISSGSSIITLEDAFNPWVQGVAVVNLVSSNFTLLPLIFILLFTPQFMGEDIGLSLFSPVEKLLVYFSVCGVSYCCLRVCSLLSFVVEAMEYIVQCSLNFSAGKWKIFWTGIVLAVSSLPVSSFIQRLDKFTEDELSGYEKHIHILPTEVLIGVCSTLLFLVSIVLFYPSHFSNKISDFNRTLGLLILTNCFGLAPYLTELLHQVQLMDDRTVSMNRFFPSRSSRVNNIGTTRALEGSTEAIEAVQDLLYPLYKEHYNQDFAQTIDVSGAISMILLCCCILHLVQILSKESFAKQNIYSESQVKTTVSPWKISGIKANVSKDDETQSLSSQKTSEINSFYVEGRVEKVESLLNGKLKPAEIVLLDDTEYLKNPQVVAEKEGVVQVDSIAGEERTRSPKNDQSVPLFPDQTGLKIRHRTIEITSTRALHFCESLKQHPTEHKLVSSVLILTALILVFGSADIVCLSAVLNGGISLLFILLELVWTRRDAMVSSRTVTKVEYQK